MSEPDQNDDVTWRLDNMDRNWLIYDQKPVPTFHLMRYKAPSEKWDHDHCSGCNVTFSENVGVGHLNKGFATAETEGISADWLCKDCYLVLRSYLDASTKR